MLHRLASAAADVASGTARRRQAAREDADKEKWRERALPEAVDRCIATHQAGKPSPVRTQAPPTSIRSPGMFLRDCLRLQFVAIAPITDPSNPAYQAAGHSGGKAEMCVAALDLEAHTCLGCYPGSGQPPVAVPEGAFEDAYAFHLSGGKGGYLIPARDGMNPLNRCDLRLILARFGLILARFGLF